MKTKKFIHDLSSQDIFDSFNNFIFSDDQKIFDKLASKINFCSITKNIPGNIVELGVFKGSGMFAWLKSLEFNSSKNKKVIGFDLFNKNKLLTSIKTDDKELMNKLFLQRSFKIDGYDKILIEILKKSKFNNYEIIKGNVENTVKNYLKKNLGFRASIVNFDLDVYKPTLTCLNLLWPRLVKGGIFIFDEYNINEWSESDAVDEFIDQKKIKIKTTNLISPSAFLTKE